MEIVKQGFDSLAEVSAELDRLDAILGEKMKGFDEKMGPKGFDSLMAECNHLVDHMAQLYNLEYNLKKKVAA